MRWTIFLHGHSGFSSLLVICLFVGLTTSLLAQSAEIGVLTGKVTDLSGAAITNATVTATSLDTGQTQSTTTRADGSYRFDGLPKGSYRLKIEAAGFKTLETSSARVDSSESAVLDEKLQPTERTNGPPAPAMQENLPDAPSSSKTEPSLSDLGFSPEQTQANPKEQALLDKRTHFLKIHQRMGLITTIPLITALALSVNSGGKSTSNADRTAHLVMGAITGDLYGITAYYAIRAPRIKGTKTKGPIKFHKTMAWIHGPGMILTPILGALAYDQKSNGEKVHGIASAHGPVAIVTAGAFGAALLSVSLKF
jgi:hypothetical protein